jgi:general secretion pathway protein L
MRSIGIDIGSATIKVAEVAQTAKGLQVISYHEHTLGQNPAFDSSLEVIEFLRSISAQYNPEQCKIVVAIRQEMVAVRNKIFPFSDRIKILKSLPFELEEDLPFSPENAIYDAKIIQITGSSAEVLACAAPKIRVAECLSRMQDAGLEVSILSTEGIALANCWERWNEPPPNRAGTQIQMEGEGRTPRDLRVLLEIGHTRTIVCAFENDSLVGVRSIFWGGKNLAESLMMKYELPYIEALKVLQSKAFVLLNQENTSYDQIVFSQAITESVRDLARDVQLTLLELQSEMNGHVHAISLTGSVSRIQNLNAYLTQQLEIPVNNVPTLGKAFTTSFELTPQIDASCGIAVGLAIEGLKKPRNPPLNFLKGEFQKQNQKFKAQWEKWGDLAKLAAAAFIILTVYAMVRDQFASSLDDRVGETLKAQAKAVAKLPAKQSNEQGVKAFIKDQRKRSQDIKDVQNLAQMTSALDILRKISDATPGKMSVTLNVRKIHIQNNRVELEGTVARAQEITALRSSLTGVSMDGKVDVMRSSISSSTGIPFAFGFNVDRGLITK